MSSCQDFPFLAFGLFPILFIRHRHGSELKSWGYGPICQRDCPFALLKRIQSLCSSYRWLSRIHLCHNRAVPVSYHAMFKGRLLLGKSDRKHGAISVCAYRNPDEWSSLLRSSIMEIICLEPMGARRTPKR